MAKKQCYQAAKPEYKHKPGRIGGCQGEEPVVKMQVDMRMSFCDTLCSRIGDLKKILNTRISSIAVVLVGQNRKQDGKVWPHGIMQPVCVEMGFHA